MKNSHRRAGRHPEHNQSDAAATKRRRQSGKCTEHIPELALHILRSYEVINSSFTACDRWLLFTDAEYSEGLFLIPFYSCWSRGSFTEHMRFPWQLSRPEVKRRDDMTRAETWSMQVHECRNSEGSKQDFTPCRVLECGLKVSMRAQAAVWVLRFETTWGNGPVKYWLAFTKCLHLHTCTDHVSALSVTT